MALANFFSRTATAASQILANFDLAAFESTISTVKVGLAFDQKATSTFEGQSTLDLTIRLLARLYPSIALIPLDQEAREHAKVLRRLTKSINPDIGFERSAKRLSACIVVGKSTPDTDCTKFYVGSEGWVAKLSRSCAVGSGISDNPFGAGAAACFGAANVFRSVFATQLNGGDLDDEIHLSMLTYTSDNAVAEQPDLKTIDLGDAHLVGLGAVGNGAIWAFRLIPELSGRLGLVDHETVDLSNLQRYAMSDQKSVEKPKADLAAKTLSATRLDVSPFQGRWSEYVQRRGNWHFERVAVALDTAEDRISLQGSLPKWIVNAWTQDVDLGVSRHAFDDGKACLACLYLPSGKRKDEHEQVAEELHMANDQNEIKGLLQTNAPLDENFVRRIAVAMDVPAEPLLVFVGQPLRIFHQKAICGGIVFRLSDGKHPVKATVPMAFQSALAGIMLAADLIKHASGQLNLPTVSTRINLLRSLGTRLHDPMGKDASGRCICNDDDFINAYRIKYA